MKLKTEVLASSSIKRKKPWPKIVWIGEEYESLLLLDEDNHRISVLYVPSGKTKKRITKLSPLILNTVTVQATKNGHYLIGLQSNGELFVWFKDKDILKTIPGLEGIVSLNDLRKEKVSLHGSNDCRNILLTVGSDQVYVWVMQTGQTFLHSNVPEVKGHWNRINVPHDIQMPPATECRELSVEAVFFSHQSLGHCCQCSFVYNNGSDVCIVTLLLRFTRIDASHDGSPSFHVEWNVIKYPFKHINSRFQPLSSRGAIVTNYIRSGQIVAVAMNQNRPALTSLLFVSPLTDTVLVSSLKGCGVKDKRSLRGRNYWVADMAWTADDLFLVCIMKSGSVCVVSRLGEPLILNIQGQGLNLGPSYYLPLHPLQIISTGEEGKVFSVDGRPVSPSSTISEADHMRQRFSVTTHPGLPIILFSDGFMVTVLQIGAEVTCLSLMRDLILLSSHHMQKIMEQENMDHSVVTAYNLPNHSGTKQGRLPLSKKKLFRFEEPDTTLNGTLDSEDTSLLEPENRGFDALSHGKILFAECDDGVIDLDNTAGMTNIEAIARHFEVAENSLFTCWKLAVSFTDIWNTETDTTTKYVTHNFVKLFSIILDFPNMEDILSLQQLKPSTAQNPRLFFIVNTFKKIMELLRFDIINQHLMPPALKFVHHTLELVLNNRELDASDPRIKTLSGCYALLKFSESILNRVYVWVPKSSSAYTGLPLEVRGQQRHAFEPAILMKAHLSPRSVAREIIYTDPRTLGLDQQAQLPGKRLCGTWKLLYRGLLQFQSDLQQHGGAQRDVEQLRSLLFAVEQIIHQINGSAPPDKSATPKLPQGFPGGQLYLNCCQEEYMILCWEKLSVDGMHTRAVDAWKQEIQNMTDKAEDAERVSKVLHSVLYTYIMRGELGKAVDFVDSLVVQGNVSDSILDHQLPASGPGREKPPLMTIVYDSMKREPYGGEHQVPCIRDRGVRQLVQSMARFMAAYFTNETLYIFPPHSPQPLPSIHLGAKIKDSRIIPKYHDNINSQITKEGLSRVWTTERALEYLLLSGLVCEAAWFADQMGDWKVGFLLSVACTQHRSIAPQVYKKKKKPLEIPHFLEPASLLQKKLESLVHLHRRGGQKGRAEQEAHNEGFIPISNETNIIQLSRTMEDIMTAGIMSGVEVVPWLLTTLVHRLMDTVAQLSPLVPQDFYLPSPPLYCPQPADTEKDKRSAEVQGESALRFQASSLIQLILIVLNSAHISLPVTRWYIQELNNVQERAAQFKSTTEGPCLEFPEVLQQFKEVESSLRAYLDEDAVKQVLLGFRDFCSLLWLLHVRDKLSFNLRSREKYLNDVNYQDYLRESWESKEGEKWNKECFTTLQWAVHMLTFSRFLSDEGCIYKVILSLLLEFPPSEDTADILAEHFYDIEILDAEVQEKLEKFLNDWQAVFIEPEDDGKSAKPEQEEDDENDGRKSVTFYQASPRGQSLSIYFSKQCEAVLKVLKKKRKVFGAFEEFVFDSSGRMPAGSLTSSLPQEMLGFCIGSRPFETKLSYLEFLDTFCAISFIKVEDFEKQSTVKPFPLLMPFAEDICSKEFEDLDKISKPSDVKTNLVVMSSPGRVDRSQNVGSAEQLASPSQAKAKLTNLASKFYQSEEALYRGQDVGSENLWSVEADFGSRYARLQKCLDWLAVWCKKQHSLGLQWKSEQDLEFRPTMKIDVSPRLVVLALWLLENKYSTARKSATKSMTLRESRKTADRQSLDNLLVQVNSEVTGALQKKTRRPRRRADHPIRTSLDQEPDQDASQMHSAYEELLNGKDESSSLEVSSLDQEAFTREFQATTSHIKTGSRPNSRERYIEYEDSYRNIDIDKQFSSRKTPSRQNSTNGSESLRQSTYDESRRSRDRRSSGRRSPQVRGQSPSHRGQPSHVYQQEYQRQPNSSVPGNLASEIQFIIRGELRKMMEAQHRSMMAMMGALEDPVEEPVTPQRQSAYHSPPGRNDTRNTMVLEELETTEDRRRARRRSPRRRQDSPEDQTRHQIRRNRSQERFQRTAEDPDFIPRYLRVEAERDIEEEPFRLPPIPMPAWAEESQRPLQEDQYDIPLLHLGRGGAPPMVYTEPHRASDYNVSHFSPSPASHPPPSYQESFFIPPVTQKPESQPQAVPQSIEMPLLKLIPEDKPFLGSQNASNFGRLLDPALLVAHEQELQQKETLKYRHAREFFQQQVENLEEMEQRQLGSQLLQADLHAPRQKVEAEMDRSLRRRKTRTTKKEESEKASSESPESVKEEMSKEAERSEGDVTEKSDTGEEQEEEEGIHDGYAIQPGAFENYLHMNEGDFEADTNARVQFRTAMLMKEQLAKEKKERRKKVDFATMTKNYEDAQIETGASLEIDSIRTAEVATSITKDTGVDPIQEAIMEYNRSRQGRALPPDIFLGLRFADANGQPPAPDVHQGERPKGRSYINVVDLDASAVLHDLGKLPEKEDKQGDDLSLAPQSVTMATAQGRNLEELEESMRDALRPTPAPVERPFKQDSVTVSMFESHVPHHNRVSVAVMPRDSVEGSRGAVIERLRDMGRHMSAIDQMAANIEKDFHSTRLMLNTLDTLTNVEDTRPEAEKDKEPVPTPKSSRKTVRTPKSSRKSPTPRTGRSTQRTLPTTSSLEEEKEGTGELVKMSGLSGISDIIGEMVEKGDIDLEEAGFTENEALKLAERIKTSARTDHTEEERERIRHSLEILERMSRAPDSREEEQRRLEEKEQLRAWMIEKRHERMEEYKKYRFELREHERRPFKPDSSSNFKGTFKVSEKGATGKENMQKRLREAQELLGDILTDKPELPPELPARERSPRRKTSRSPPRERILHKTSPVRDRSPKVSSSRPVYRPPSPKRHQTVRISAEVEKLEYDDMLDEAEEIVQIQPIRPPVRRAPSPKSPTRQVPRLRLVDSDEFLQRTGETTGEISAYARAVESMEASQDITVRDREPEKQEPVKVYKQKSFKDMVRLQRPEVTRKAARIQVSREHVWEEEPKEVKKSEKETVPKAKEPIKQEMEREPTDRTSQDQLTVQESKKMVTPRRVKTYAERLKDMRENQPKFSTPIVPRVHAPPAKTTTVQRKPVGPSHKPKTYVEQLQQLNPGSKTRLRTPGPRTVQGHTFLKSHKPLHKPKTYVQQLKNIQAPFKEHPKPKRVVAARGQVRPRPYADPYKDQWDRESVLSDWSVDDNVKRLLYDEDERSTMYGRASNTGISMDYTISEGVSDYYDAVMDDEYLGSVDIDEIAQIADAASVRSGSVMSVIDWDAVEDLIADVK
ncbi:ciliogenesis and planar polarity effector 1-like isoform X1 [Saccostrea cucullata]|uniref:ciliogenesis and planar polarity effector 1-like isoform X1 n=1 Tax=Saccostrea cuccullata TaxID=36930 RepID=UPI002ED6B9C3